jgi:Holliday junction resolvase
MTTTAQRRGKDWERAIREYCRNAGLDYEQLRMTGTFDEGDGVIRLPNGVYIVVEAKNTAKLDLAGHLAEAVLEATNFAKHRKFSLKRVFGVLFQKRRGKPVGESYVVMTVDDFIRLIIGEVE